MSKHLESEAKPSPGELSVDTASNDGTIVVAVRGELDIASAPRFKLTLETAESGDVRLVIVDLAELQFIDSTGLRVLLDAKRRASAAGGDLRIVNARGEVRRLLEIAGVLELLSAEHD